MGLILGYYLKPFLLFAPAVFIAFSALSSGAVKWRWVGFALLPWLVERLIFVLLAALVVDRASYSFVGRGPIYVLCWISAWLVYLAYWRRFRPAGDAAQPYFWPQRIKWVVIGAIALIAARYLAWVTRIEYPVGPWLLFWAIEIALIVAVVRASPKLPLRIAGAVLVIVLANWIAWFDNAIAEREFAKLCKEQAGTRIYKTIELGPEYFTPEGELAFFKADGDFDVGLFPSEFVFIPGVNQAVVGATWSQTKRSFYEVRDKTSGNLVGEFAILYGDRGGPPGLNPDYRPIAGGDCPAKFIRTKDFLAKIFVKRKGTQ